MIALEYIRWIVGLALLVFCTCVSVCNIALVCRAIFRHWRGTLIPIVGGVCGMIGILIIPCYQLRTYCWIPLLMDVGCGPLIVGGVISVLFLRKSN